MIVEVYSNSIFSHGGIDKLMHLRHILFRLKWFLANETAGSALARREDRQ